jgi:FkbM family methyltransferase
VIDAGANVGDYTAAFHELGARVVAVEPDAEALAELDRRFGEDDRITVVSKGLSDSEGTQRLYVSTDGGSPLSTMSEEWISAAQGSGRFTQFEWKPAGEVEVTTLDSLIETFGTPAFVKIDVEGFELPVVRGLSTPVPAISLEFHPEYGEQTLDALRHLADLGAADFMYAPGESSQALGKSMPGAPESWTDFDGIRERLMGDADEPEFGDVLARTEAR